MKYRYTARTPEGKKETGVVEAFKKEAALAILQRHNLIVTGLESIEEKKGLKREIRILPQKIGAQDIVFFFRQLSILFAADVPLIEALDILAKQTKNPLLAAQVSEISDNVEGGMAFSEALSRYPKVFSKFEINMIKTGEVAGNLGKILNYLADHTERNYMMISKIKGAMMYPAFIFGAAILVMIIMVTFVLPKMSEMFEEFGVEQLPLPTRIIMSISDFFSKNWILVFAVIIGLFVFLSRYIKTPKGRSQKDKIEIKIPVMGKIFQDIYTSRITENLGTLIKGGIPIVQALDTTALVIGNTLYEKVLKEARDSVRRGETIADAFKAAEVIPPTLTQMIASGEKSGKLDKVLMDLTGFYNAEVTRSLDNLMTLIEPIILVIMGIMVAFIAVAVLLPIYNLAGTIM